MALQCHTARFRLVPSLKAELNILTPALRKPGAKWQELPRPAATAASGPNGHVRIAYARASTARQSLDTQLDAFTKEWITRVFSEEISTRVKDRPELEKAIALACELRAAGVRVTLVIHEHKRLGRGHDLMTLAVRLREADVKLEFLTGELRGSHDPHGPVLAVLAALSGGTVSAYASRFAAMAGP